MATFTDLYREFISENIDSILLKGMLQDHGIDEAKVEEYLAHYADPEMKETMRTLIENIKYVTFDKFRSDIEYLCQLYNKAKGDKKYALVFQNPSTYEHDGYFKSNNWTMFLVSLYLDFDFIGDTRLQRTIMPARKKDGYITHDCFPGVEFRANDNVCFISCDDCTYSGAQYSTYKGSLYQICYELSNLADKVYGSSGMNCTFSVILPYVGSKGALNTILNVKIIHDNYDFIEAYNSHAEKHYNLLEKKYGDDDDLIDKEYDNLMKEYLTTNISSVRRMIHDFNPEDSEQMDKFKSIIDKSYYWYPPGAIEYISDLSKSIKTASDFVTPKKIPENNKPLIYFQTKMADRVSVPSFMIGFVYQDEGEPLFVNFIKNCETFTDGRRCPRGTYKKVDYLFRGQSLRAWAADLGGEEDERKHTIYHYFQKIADRFPKTVKKTKEIEEVKTEETILDKENGVPGKVEVVVMEAAAKIKADPTTTKQVLADLGKTTDALQVPGQVGGSYGDYLRYKQKYLLLREVIKKIN